MQTPTYRPASSITGIHSSRSEFRSSCRVNAVIYRKLTYFICRPANNVTEAFAGAFSIVMPSTLKEGMERDVLPFFQHQNGSTDFHPFRYLNWCTTHNTRKATRLRTLLLERGSMQVFWGSMGLLAAQPDRMPMPTSLHSHIAAMASVLYQTLPLGFEFSSSRSNSISNI